MARRLHPAGSGRHLFDLLADQCALDLAEHPAAPAVIMQLGMAWRDGLMGPWMVLEVSHIRSRRPEATWWDTADQARQHMRRRLWAGRQHLIDVGELCRKAAARNADDLIAQVEAHLAQQVEP